MTKTPKKIIFVCIPIAALLSVFLCLNKDKIIFPPWVDGRAIERPSYMGGNGERSAVIVNSETSVLVLNTAGELVYRLDAKPGRAKSFSALKFAELDGDNNLYVMDVFFGGAFEENAERILKYSEKGILTEELYAYRYTNENFSITKGKLCGMAWFDHAVYLVRLDDRGFFLERTPDAADKNPPPAEELRFFEYPNAFRDVAYVHINPENRLLALTTKAGAVKQYDFEGALLHSLKTPGADSLPWTAISTADSVIYADIISGEIVSVDVSTNEKTVLYRSLPEESPYYRIGYTKGILFAAPYDRGTGAAFFGNTGKDQVQKIKSYSYSKENKILTAVLFACSIVDIILLLVSVISVVIMLSRIRTSGSIKTIILVGMCIAFGAVVSSMLIINEMNNRYMDKTYDGLENISRLIAASVDSGLLSSIGSPAQSEDPEYLCVKKNLRDRFTRLQFNGMRVYQIISKEQDGTIYVLYDLENSVGTFFPASGYDSSYNDASKQFVRFRKTGPEGNWLFVRGPIPDKDGKTVAFIETGYEMKTVYQETNRILLRTWLMVSAVVIALPVAAVLILLLKARKRNRKTA
jgi:hypothetical protein